jgi:hypothetical protein
MHPRTAQALQAVLERSTADILAAMGRVKKSAESEWLGGTADDDHTTVPTPELLLVLDALGSVHRELVSAQSCLADERASLAALRDNRGGPKT